jgi:hypothetical protein
MLQLIWIPMAGSHLLARWLLAQAIFYSEDGGNTFLRNVGLCTD